MTQVRFNGLIQHSFALQIDKSHRRFHGQLTRGRIDERFSLAASGGVAFGVKAVDDSYDQSKPRGSTFQSPLAEHRLTAVEPLRTEFLVRRSAGNLKYERDLPRAFSWAAKGREESPRHYEEARCVFGGLEESGGSVSQNDFLVTANGCNGWEEPIAQPLLEVIANRRSRLFGLTLASRFVNVMLPHAILAPVDPCPGSACGSWILQPLVSFIRSGKKDGELRSTYSLTLILVPVKEQGLAKRKMTMSEICQTVNAGWGLATSPPPAALPMFDVRGPLPDYISRLGRIDLRHLLQPSSARSAVPAGEAKSGGKCQPVSLRQVAELTAFGVALGVAQGATGSIDERAKRRIGSDVVISLGSARVSSVVVVDKDLKTAAVERSSPNTCPPGSLVPLMERLAWEARPLPFWTTGEAKPPKFRLDRPFVDGRHYCVGVLPSNRCMIVTSAADAQLGRVESGLMQAGSTVYMTIGAATAIGTMRAIDRELVKLDGADPTKIAPIDSEIATDLHEIYDLDITREAFRSIYRLLRKRLGIVRDYATLQDKMQTLYRANATRHESKLERQTLRLSYAVIALAILTVIVELIK